MSYQNFQSIIYIITLFIIAGCASILSDSDSELANINTPISEPPQIICSRETLIDKYKTQIEEARILNFMRSEPIVQIVMDCNKGVITRLYNKMFHSNPKEDGVILVTITISAGGDVTNAEISESEIKSADFLEQLIKTIKLLKFPIAQNDTTSSTIPNSTPDTTSITYPIEFTALGESSTRNANRAKRRLNEYSVEELYPDEKLRRLAIASGEGNIKEMDRLIKEGADVNAKGIKKATALFWSLKNFTGFRHLLEQGADPNVVFEDRNSVLHLSVQKGNIKFLKEALKYSANPNLRAGYSLETPIYHITTSNYFSTEKLNMLVDAGADINIINSKGESFIAWAARLNRFDLVFAALIKGANFAAINSDFFNFQRLLKSIDGNEEQLLPDQTLWFGKIILWLQDKGIDVKNE